MRVLAFAGLLLFCASLAAAEPALVARFYPNKKEDDVAKEFLKKLPDFLRNMVATKNSPRAQLVFNKKTVIFSELKSVEGKGDKNIWVELVKVGWFTNVAGYAWGRSETTYWYDNKDIAPSQVASWFDGRRDAPELIVALCVWLAKNNELTVANHRLTELVSEKAHPELRADAEAYLCLKNKWTPPETGGLRMIPTRDFLSAAGSGLMLTEDAEKDHVARLDAKAKEALDMLLASRGDDKGEIGSRKNPPKERIDELLARCKRFVECFYNTPTVKDAEKMTKLSDMQASLEADYSQITTLSENGDGMISRDPAGAIKVFEKLTKADPANPHWRSRLAYAYHLEGGLHMHGGCNNPKAMKKAAELYEPLCEEFPLNGHLFTIAGACLYATGEKVKAKAALEKAVKLLEEKDRDRDLAESLLKNLK